MKKITFLLFALVAMCSAAVAQSQQELLEAYRNGTLTQAQIGKAQQNNANVRRTRQATAAATTAAQSQQATMQEQDWQNGYYINGRYVPGIQYTLGTDGTFRFNTNDPRYKILTRESRDFDPRRGQSVVEMEQSQRDSLLRLMPELQDMLEEKPKVARIFGHDMFNNSQMTFEPNLNIATPDNYVLGAG
ncbi:MAG: hypothetical protein IIW91_01385, partial [Alistipes sp.]|nr:hypothetical protein [Alistipes sp.]